MISLIWLVVLVSALFLYFRQVYSRFSKYGVRHFKPIPPVGNMGAVLFRRIHLIDNFIKIYHSFPEDRFVGIFNFFTPIIIARDPELIKNIVIKDFEHFLDHTTLVDDTVDPLLGRGLFSLKGQEWKNMRSTLSPAFTSSKMRLMVPFMVQVGNQMIKSLKKSIKESPDKFVDVECRDLSTRYANDVIASCAFGVKVDSHNEKDNQFYEMGKLTTNISFKQFMMIMAFNSFPKLAKKLKLTLFVQATRDFFSNLVTDMMDNRTANNIIRPDMIHLLMEAKKGKLTHEKQVSDEDAGFATVEETDVGKKPVDTVWTDTDLIAQALLFFFAGFDTVSTVMTFALHELAMNPDVQERLLEEIKENEIQSGGKFDYNSIQKMKYMDMVTSEILRKWAPVAALDRTCTKDYNLGRANKEAKHDYILRKGEVINIPAWTIHRNPQFYENPNKFDPERFSDENKHLIKPFTYIPFGLGPRNCIGSRFALCEVKVMVYQVLQHFTLSPCEKTCVTEKLDPSTFRLQFKGGQWLRFRIRN